MSMTGLVESVWLSLGLIIGVLGRRLLQIPHFSLLKDIAYYVIMHDGLYESYTKLFSRIPYILQTLP
jgi:hypothetical protein